eukprot:scaffold17267_cov123-Isochrysis_galbana.AAC.3
MASSAWCAASALCGWCAPAWRAAAVRWRRSCSACAVRVSLCTASCSACARAAAASARAAGSSEKAAEASDRRWRSEPFSEVSEWSCERACRQKCGGRWYREERGLRWWEDNCGEALGASPPQSDTPSFPLPLKSLARPRGVQPHAPMCWGATLSSVRDRVPRTGRDPANPSGNVHAARRGRARVVPAAHLC